MRDWTPRSSTGSEPPTNWRSPPWAQTGPCAFQEPDDADPAAIDHAYQTKYAHYGSSYVDPIISPNATAATLRLIAR